MKQILIDGRTFEGPYVLGKDEIPGGSGIALVCTDAGEGMKVMSVIQGDNICKAVSESPKKACWEKHAYHGIIDVYVDICDLPESKREEFRINAISKRASVIFCDELPKIEDDW